ncbi:MAG TPA: ABC transporter ATP-binding protein [Bacilli bacterium]|nr:ABC transporter ATP-binding protein [Bacilli bacterium]
MNENNNYGDIVLQGENLGIVFGGLHAVDNFNISIKKGELVGLIGPNGAGKTTAFNLLTGVYKPTVGDVYIKGKKVTKLSPHLRVTKGIARTFQNIRLFKKLSVLDNVKVAFNSNMKYSPLTAIFRLPKFWKEEQEIDRQAKDILEVFNLNDVEEEYACNLPYGKQRKLEIARAIATNPQIILLDEPAAGMNPTETDELMDTIKIVKEKYNVSILLIEHDMKLVMGICERIVVLNYGKIIASGSPQEIQSNKDVITAYLGEEVI